MLKYLKMWSRKWTVPIPAGNSFANSLENECHEWPAASSSHAGCKEYLQMWWHRWMNTTMLHNSFVLPIFRNSLSVYSPTRIILVEFCVHLLWEKKLSQAVANIADNMVIGLYSEPIALVEWEVWCWNHLRSSGLIFFPGKFPLPTTGKIHCHISNQSAWSYIITQKLLPWKYPTKILAWSHSVEFWVS